MSWQPIDSCPYNREVLVYGKCAGMWMARKVHDGRFDDGDHYHDIKGLTHWMPLPEPPRLPVDEETK